jgi:hypothetical protein
VDKPSYGLRLFFDPCHEQAHCDEKQSSWPWAQPCHDVKKKSDKERQADQGEGKVNRKNGGEWPVWEMVPSISDKIKV